MSKEGECHPISEEPTWEVWRKSIGCPIWDRSIRGRLGHGVVRVVRVVRRVVRVVMGEESGDPGGEEEVGWDWFTISNRQ